MGDRLVKSGGGTVPIDGLTPFTGSPTSANTIYTNLKVAIGKNNIYSGVLFDAPGIANVEGLTIGFERGGMRLFSPVNYQSAISAAKGLQLIGMNDVQSYAMGYNGAAGTGIGDYHIIIPLSKNSAAGLALFGSVSQTGNFFEATSYANVSSMHGDLFKVSKDGYIGVGLGVDAPTAPLHTRGKIRVETANKAAGRIFASDANGNGDWEAFGTIMTGSDAKKYLKRNIEGTDYFIPLLTALP